MSRRPGDRDDDSFEDVFRLMERIIEDMTDNVDRMMGPYGHVDFDVHRRETPRGSQRRESATETHVDVQADDDEIRAVADLPGVVEADIEVRCDGRVLSIAAQGDRREYDERIRLPAAVEEAAATATYNNGVLEITLPRDDTDGTRIQVE
jgi:HSP20 family protein